MITVKELLTCPVETTLTRISDKWKVLILRDLLPGTKRNRSLGSAYSVYVFITLNARNSLAAENLNTVSLQSFY